MELIAFPFRFKPDGSVAKVTQTSDDHTAQRIYGFVKTTSGELPLALGYGLTDPVFANIELGEVEALRQLRLVKTANWQLLFPLLEKKVFTEERYNDQP